MSTGSNAGSSPADPPFAQLSGSTKGGWGDFASQIGAGLIAGGDANFSKSLNAAGDMKAFQKRRDQNKNLEQYGIGAGQRQQLRDSAEELLKSHGGR